MAQRGPTVKRHTCDKCKHYTPPSQTMVKHYPNDANDGACSMMGDSNDVEVTEPDRCYGWDYEGYRAGVYVGPKFGCIHWVRKDLTKE